MSGSPVQALLIATSFLAGTAGLTHQEAPAGTLATSAKVYTYDARHGDCRTSAGEVGFNPAPADLFAKAALSPGRQPTFTGQNAECMDLSGISLPQLERTYGYKGYMQLIAWNLRGANLNGADLHFSYVTKAQLGGVQLSAAKFGYTTVSGQADEHSQLPKFCTRTGTAASCIR